MNNDSFGFERSLVGGLMKLGNGDSELSKFIVSHLKPSNFYHMTFREIFKAICLLQSKGSYFDNLSVIQFMSNNENIPMTDIDLCYQYRADPSLLREYAKEIKNQSVERFTVSKIADLTDMVSNKENGTIQERIGLAESVLNGLIEQMQDREQEGLKDGMQLATEFINEMEAFSKGDILRYDTGFSGLDDILDPRGIKGGSLVVVGARPKMGKTFFLSKMAEHYAVNRNEATCLFSMEMRSVDIWERMLSSYGNINSNRFYTETLDDQNPFWKMAGKHNADLARTKIYVDDRAGNTIRNIKAEVRKVHRKQKVGMIGVDYLTLMNGDEAERNDLKYAAITKELKMLAKELNCIIVLLVQLNRGLESRTDKRPMPSDSRDTGQIEQDCDVWIGLYRESVYNKNCGHNITEAIIRLNRAGESGTAFMKLSNGYFEDVNKEEAIMLMEREVKAKGGEDGFNKDEYNKKRARV